MSDRQAAVNRLEPLTESAAKDFREALQKLQVALNTVKLVAKESLQFLPKGYRHQPGHRQKGDAYNATWEAANSIATELEQGKALAEVKRLLPWFDELVSETKAWMADPKVASASSHNRIAARVAYRYAASSMANRIRDVHQWMGESLSKAHQSEQFLKGVLNEVNLLAHSGNHDSKAHADHLKKALDAIVRVEKETKTLVDVLDHLAREFK